MKEFEEAYHITMADLTISAGAVKKLDDHNYETEAPAWSSIYKDRTYGRLSECVRL